jgi:PadR family transcriptional regulator PadR
MSTIPMQLLPGTLDFLVLKAASWHPEHGYGIARLIEERSGDTIRVEEGALYQALHRLERQGLLASEWGTSSNNRRAKFYRLTDSGRTRLQREVSDWRRYAAAVGVLLDHP